MLRIGLTGGIGSGKTLVGKVFSLLNIPIFSADEQAKKLYREEYLREELKKRFGEGLYKNNLLDKQKLANIIFNDRHALNELNQLVHPLVWEKFNKWCNNYLQIPYVVHEAAILLESGGKQRMDKVVYVKAPEKMRLNRIRQRDDLTEQEIKQRMKYQMNENEKERLCDHLIVNDDSMLVIPQVIKIHEHLINKSKNMS